MIALLALTAIDTNAERDYLREADAPVNERDLDLDTDDLEQPIAASAANVQAISRAMESAPVQVYMRVTINLDEVREFYVRKNSRPGTRITFKNGAARIVKETYDEVMAKITSTPNSGVFVA